MKQFGRDIGDFRLHCVAAEQNQSDLKPKNQQSAASSPEAKLIRAAGQVSAAILKKWWIERRLGEAENLENQKIPATEIPSKAFIFAMG